VAGIRACLLVKALWFLYNLGIKGRLFSNAFLRAAKPLLLARKQPAFSQ
jgi:hypothetical protein